MFTSRKRVAAKPQDGDGYDDEQHLVAAVSEFKKVESSTQTMVDQLYQRLASPFQITTKPCEASRAAVLQCYQQLHGGAAVGGSGDASPSSSSSANVSEGVLSNNASATAGGDAWLFIPYQQCYEAAMAYNRCVEKDTLSSHLVLVGAFEQRGAEQQTVHKAVMEAQRSQQQNIKQDTR
ncbi:putative mitochondrial hypothetical protein [Leptomonas pyrrhocoris]|uniref:Uncharacterized protein n=1 Tax=Leptomonas pyrrhocoris TaxID=157538 RepID=A0A0M9GA46_LEPPY|nr:putative mitochondrial hypothetical protein [Leptomonas pyrrhocoris]KPA85963.1 putative mitochondrial hypothetical protein [Leptomonas pyrrhocoris]|eukprot:XP_015664402.1 putative mitochondrial hypothetical protein [Leptomonas pyrrhocoris]